MPPELPHVQSESFADITREDALENSVEAATLSTCMDLVSLTVLEQMGVQRKHWCTPLAKVFGVFLACPPRMRIYQIDSEVVTR